MLLRHEVDSSMRSNKTHRYSYNYTHTVTTITTLTHQHTQIYTAYTVHTYTREKCAENVKEAATREQKQSKAAQ